MDDMELVLFELDETNQNIPDGVTSASLNDIATEKKLSYTVHLPLDLLYTEGNCHPSLVLAKKAIEATQTLTPYGFIAHLDGRSVRKNPSCLDYQAWVNQAVTSLEMVAKWAGGFEHIALENLEGYPLDFLEPVIHQVPVSLCIDVGHLWIDRHDPIPYMQKHISRTKIIHLHGINEHDHTSLAYLPALQVYEILDFLETSHFEGVVTLEVFGEVDFRSSIKVLIDWYDQRS